MILMEHQEDSSIPLSDYLATYILDWRRKLLLARKLAMILQDLHQYQIVHR
jgi:hypothetical protein